MEEYLNISTCSSNLLESNGSETCNGTQQDEKTRRDESIPSIFGYLMGLELSQLGRRDGTRGWRKSAALRAHVWDVAGQEGEERNAKELRICAAAQRRCTSIQGSLSILNGL
jgi:hypothetical protein